jgi:hypothetical protein
MKKRKHVVRLQENHEDVEPYAEEGRNVMRATVLKGSNGKDRIMLELSRDAMLGLGTALIRWAHEESRSGAHAHLHPVDRELISQYMGVFMAPDSCEVIFIPHVEMGVIEDLLDEEKKSDG